MIFFAIQKHSGNLFELSFWIFYNAEKFVFDKIFQLISNFSHLYRSSSFNSSGRSSNCDTTEDMYSDVSLEDVQDLNHKLELLQRQITNLADTQMNTDDRTRTKTDYAVLQTKYHMLEEQLRETEMRTEEKLVEEQKRYRELLTRVEREAELKNENCQIRIQTMDAEAATLREELQRLRIQCDKQSVELTATDEKLDSSRFNLSVAQENLIEARAIEKRYLADKNNSEQLITELTREIERIRTETEAVMATVKRANFHHISASSLSLESNGSSETFRVEELQNELEDTKAQNRQLREANEELQAMLLNKNIEEGRNLLNGGTSMANLADELKEMGQNQVSNILRVHCSLIADPCLCFFGELSQDDALMNSLNQVNCHRLIWCWNFLLCNNPLVEAFNNS